jgi:hypothetical protein
MTNITRKNMGHFHIERKGNNKNHKPVQGHANKNSILNVEHSTKRIETMLMKRKI